MLSLPRLATLVRRVLAGLNTPEGGWITVGIAVRLLSMPTTVHNDTFWIPWMAQSIVAGHYNVYQYLFDAYGERVLGPIVWAPYFPLFYGILAGWLAGLRALGLMDAGTWYTGFIALANVVPPDQWTADQLAWHVPGYHRALVMVKGLNLPFDLLVLLSLRRWVTPPARIAAVALWASSPIVLVSCYMVGQNDLIPTALVCAAVSLLVPSPGASDRWRSARSLDFGALLLGLAAATKYYPLLLVIPLALAVTRTTGALVRFVAISAAVFGATISPFLGSQAFVQSALLNREAQGATGVVQGIGIVGLSPFWLCYFALVLALVRGRGRSVAWTDPRWVTLATLALLIGLGRFPFNWFVWLWPLVVWVASSDVRARLLAPITSACALLWSTDWGASLGAGLLNPLSAGLGTGTSVKGVLASVLPWGPLIATNNALLTACLAVAVVAALARPGADKTPGLRPGPGPAIASLVVLAGWLVTVVAVAI
jgi:hypothetical protein